MISLFELRHRSKQKNSPACTERYATVHDILCVCLWNAAEGDWYSCLLHFYLTMPLFSQRGKQAHFLCSCKLIITSIIPLFANFVIWNLALPFHAHFTDVYVYFKKSLINCIIIIFMVLSQNSSCPQILYLNSCSSVNGNILFALCWA